jgi:hypothetical protein
MGVHYSEQACGKLVKAYYMPKHFNLHSSLCWWTVNCGGSWPCAIVVDMKHEAFEKLLPEAQQQQSKIEFNNPSQWY